MAVTLSDLDPAAVAQSEAYLVQLLRDKYPSLDLSEGTVLRNVLLRPAALYHTWNQDQNDLVRQSMSLQAIAANPQLSDPTLVDAVLSNFNTTRDQGLKSVGQLLVILSDLLTTTIEIDSVFSYNGLNYFPVRSFTGVTTVGVILDDSQRLIAARADGTFAFVIDVTAENVGAEYQVKQATRFTTAAVISNLVDVMAIADFQAGRSADSNQDLINKLKLGIAPQVFSGRIQIEAMIRQAVLATQAVSIIGFGDSEMKRDKHNIFAISTGGKADVYVRTQSQPQVVRLLKKAVLIDPATHTWQLTLNRDDAPGFYAVENILPEKAIIGSGSLEILSDTRGIDVSADGTNLVPEIFDTNEGVYSRFQTAVIRFTDPELSADAPAEASSSSSSSGSGTTIFRDYAVSVLVMPNLVPIQNLASGRETTSPKGDYLVRAPIPIFCTVELLVRYANDADVPDIPTIQRAVATAVQNLNFNLGRLPSSVIYNAVHSVMAQSSTLVVAPIEMYGVLRKPSGAKLVLRSARELVVPEIREESISSRTTVFFLPETGVSVKLEKINVAKV
jgi:hypothetical protein